MNFALRPMRSDDISQVAEIEAEAFPTTWPPSNLKRELENRQIRYLVAWASRDAQSSQAQAQPRGGPQSDAHRPWLWRVVSRLLGLSAPSPETDEQPHCLIAGYVAVWFMVEEAHITSIAVREAHRRNGLGELLLMGAIELAVARRAQRVTLEARISNFPAHALYEKYGFQRTGVRKGYYADNHEDAVIMSVESILSPRYLEFFQARVDAFRQRRGEIVRTLA